MDLGMKAYPRETPVFFTANPIHQFENIAHIGIPVNSLQALKNGR
jgi:hypothetical protein